MKKPVLPFFLIAALGTQAQTTLLEESFDTYTEGSGMASNDPDHWALWAPGEDQAVSTAYALSGLNSLACVSDNAADGGPGDLLLLLGDRTTGIYDLAWSMYIPADKGGYFNIQHNQDVTPASFGAEVKFAGGTITATTAGSEATGTYVPGEWLNILINVDLDNAGAALFVNATPITTWPFDMDTEGGAVTPQLGAIDFYSYGDGTALGEYYVDDVSYVQTSAGGIGMAENHASLVRIFPNPAQEAVYVSLKEASGRRTSARLVDVTGKQVAQPITLSARAWWFPIADLAKGVYFVQVDDGSRSLVERVMKL